MTETTWAVYSRFQGVVSVHYSHLTEQQAEDEVDRVNGHLQAMGRFASFWAEQHHPEAVFVIG
jgi:hypothetical protein